MLGRDKVRKSIVIFGIILSFILGTLVSASSATAQMGTPFLQEEIDFLNDLIMELQAQFAPNVILLHHDQTELEELPATTGDPVFKIFAKWEIVKDVNFDYDEISTILFASSVYADIKGNVNFGWYKSEDDMIWRGLDTLSASNSDFKVQREFDDGFTISPQINFIALAAINTIDEGDDAMIKDFSGTMTIHLPPGQSLDKICCSP